MQKEDKYASVKEEIAAIYHENKGRYGYRRITAELRKRKFSLNHKTVQWLMKELGLVCRVRMNTRLAPLIAPGYHERRRIESDA